MMITSTSSTYSAILANIMAAQAQETTPAQPAAGEHHLHFAPPPPRRQATVTVLLVSHVEGPAKFHEHRIKQLRSPGRTVSFRAA